MQIIKVQEEQNDDRFRILANSVRNLIWLWHLISHLEKMLDQNKVIRTDKDLAYYDYLKARLRKSHQLHNVHQERVWLNLPWGAWFVYRDWAVCKVPERDCGFSVLLARKLPVGIKIEEEPVPNVIDRGCLPSGEGWIEL